MITPVLLVIVALWLFSCVLRLLCMAFVPPTTPCFNGFKIRVPPASVSMLTPKELQAVITHEQGHRYRGHVWRNFIGACFFVYPSRATRIRQELEADDYAMQRGHGHALASALSKRSFAGFDTFRIRRLVGYLHVE